MNDIVEAAAAALVNQYPRLQQMSACERHARFKLVIEAVLMAYLEFRPVTFSDN